MGANTNSSNASLTKAPTPDQQAREKQTLADSNIFSWLPAWYSFSVKSTANISGKHSVPVVLFVAVHMAGLGFVSVSRSKSFVHQDDLVA